MFPVDTIKTHTQCIRCNTTTSTAWAAAQDLVAREGYFRLWRGVQTMMGACIPAHAAYFSIFEFMKETLGANEGGHRPVQAGLAGAVATVAHDSIMTPMDVCKQRLQLGWADQALYEGFAEIIALFGSYYKGVIDCFKTVSKEEGVRAFFISLPTTLIMNIPYG